MKKTVFIFSLVFVIVLLAGCSNKNDSDSSSGKETYRQVDAETAKELMDNETDYIIPDVRTEDEYD